MGENSAYSGGTGFPARWVFAGGPELTGVPTPADPDPALYFLLPLIFPGGIFVTGAFLG